MGLTGVGGVRGVRLVSALSAARSRYANRAKTRGPVNRNKQQILALGPQDER